MKTLCKRAEHPDVSKLAALRKSGRCPPPNKKIFRFSTPVGQNLLCKQMWKKRKKPQKSMFFENPRGFARKKKKTDAARRFVLHRFSTGKIGGKGRLAARAAGCWIFHNLHSPYYYCY